GVFKPFEGQTPIAHRLYCGHQGLLGTPDTKNFVLVHISPAPAADPWPQAVTWEIWNGASWQSLSAVVNAESKTTWEVILTYVPASTPLTVGGVVSSWLRASLTTALPSGQLQTSDDGGSELRRDGVPEAGFAADLSSQAYEAIDFSTAFLPF